MTERAMSSGGSKEVPEDSFDLREAIGFVWRHWKFVVSMTALVCAVGGVILIRTTPLYTASTQVLLESQQQQPLGAQLAGPQITLDISMINSQMAIIRSAAFLSRVVERDHLAADSAFARNGADSGQLTMVSKVASFFSGLLPSEVSFAASEHSETQAVPVSDNAATADGDTIPPAERPIVKALSGGLKVSRSENDGDVLTISYTSPDPDRSARIANEIAAAYLVDKLDARFEATKRASAWLGDRLVSLQQQAHDSEAAVEAFKAQHGLIQSGNGVTLTQQQLSELNGNLIAAKADLAQKKAQVDLLNSLTAKGDSLQDMPEITNAGALPALRAQLGALSEQEAKLLIRYDKSYPLVINLDAQIRQVQQSIAAETERLAAAIRNDYALAQAREASLQASLNQATGQTNLDDATAVQLHELERTAEVNKTLFEDFLKQSKITQADATFEPQDARVITPALAPGQPSSPNKTRFMAMTLFLGLLSGVGGAFAKEKLRAGFTTPKEIEDQLGLPLLASITQITPRELKSEQGALRIYDLPAAKPLGRYSEAIRSLRSGIHMTDVDHPPKIIQVTSAAPGEGKTTIAMSLAASAAVAKLKVLLIDADLRHPSTTRAVGVANAKGLVDLLAGDVDLADALVLNKNAGYWVIGAGSKTQNPPDLLGSEKMKVLIAGFRNNYDLVIIDTPPCGPVIDPIVVAHLCDKIAYVIHWGRTTRELVKHSAAQLSGHRKIAGAVLNQVKENEAQKYGRHAYSYYYASRHYKDYYIE